MLTEDGTIKKDIHTTNRTFFETETLILVGNSKSIEAIDRQSGDVKWGTDFSGEFDFSPGY